MRKFLIALVLAMLATSVAQPVSAGTKTDILYYKVSDGVEIALRVFFPAGYDAQQSYPALFEIEGYGGAGSPNDTTYINDANNGGKYVVVGMSLRGTGCSGGQLDLFSDRSSLDGKEVLDDWLPNQSTFKWNGKAGIYGHSYSGLTGFLVAAQTPTNLDAIAVSGLIDDFYRGILYPGGVANPGFPVLFGAGTRPLAEHSGNTGTLQSDQRCRENYASHLGSNLVPAKALQDTYPAREATPDSWAIKQGLMNKISGINKPIQLGQQYQDEQTGPRGGHVLWENIPAGVPKRINLSTGRHNPNDPTLTKRDWLDCWILNGGSTGNAQSGKSCADVTDPNQKVLLHFEQIGSTRPAPYVASDWPLPETDWRKFNLCAFGALSESTASCDGSVTYASTATGRHMTLDVGAAASTGAPLAPYGFTTGLPDTARYELPFDSTQAIAGPIAMDLWATSSSPDTNFWVEVLDKDLTTGATTFVQRGVQKASFENTYDESKSAKIATGPHAGEVYRPYHSFIGSQLLTPGEANRFRIEVFPLGHIFRPGHVLVLQVHTPPANDPISTYAYEPNAGGTVTILQDPDHRTSVLLPFLNNLDQSHYRATAPTCGQVNGEVCITPKFG